MNKTKANYYVTTSIPYVNGEPHVGHAMEFLIGDVLARYARKHIAKRVIFSTGTDEHGGKNAEKAHELGLSPQAFVDKMSKNFLDLQTKLNVQIDRFIRTTDKGHEQRAQIIWNNLRPDIYKAQFIGLYCTGCERFVTETEATANNNICPDHNRPYETVEEKNYFFNLGKYTEQITKAIKDGSFKVVPESRRNEILSVLKDGLQDISISRPASKIDWGIPVPDDHTQNMYVWFEALMNYLTVIGYPEHQDFKDFWPANVQIIGKDILRFHAAIWPGMLLGLGLPLPKVLYVHGHVTLNGKKMSKSLGNVVSPQEILDKYGLDPFRYYFLRHIPSYDDGDFSWERFEEVYNNELANELGNLVQRVVVMIQKYQEGMIGDIPPSEHDMGAYHRALEDCRFDKALEEAWEQVRGLNQYIDEEKPWMIAKGGDHDHLREVLSYAVSSLLEIAELLEPFMPDTSAKITAIFEKGVVKALDKPLFPKQEKPAADAA